MSGFQGEGKKDEKGDLLGETGEQHEVQDSWKRR